MNDDTLTVIMTACNQPSYSTHASTASTSGSVTHAPGSIVVYPFLG